MAEPRTFNRRRHERFTLAPMYTSITARRRGDGRACTGHAYDVSESGLRIELDDDGIRPGEAVDLELNVAGDDLDVNATVEVVRLFETDDDPGPRRMGVTFRRFRTPGDRDRLVRWLGSGHLQRAA